MATGDRRVSTVTAPGTWRYVVRLGAVAVAVVDLPTAMASPREACNAVRLWLTGGPVPAYATVWPAPERIA
jgi:hypothetical protein